MESTSAQIIYRDENGDEVSVEVPPEGVFLGRGSECAVRAGSRMVSRKNSRVYRQDGHWIVEDVGSSNGTFLNGTRVQKYGLKDGDEVSCAGALNVRFVVVSPTAPPPAREVSTKVQVLPLEPVAAPVDCARLLREANAIRERLRTALAATAVRLAEAEERNRALEQRLGEVERHVGELERDRATLQAQIGELERENAAVQAQLADARAAERQRKQELEEQIVMCNLLRWDLEQQPAAGVEARIAERDVERELPDSVAADLRTNPESWSSAHAAPDAEPAGSLPAADPEETLRSWRDREP